ncbi:CASP-like protein 1C1 [Silene latifolia]|uniref:CASP-like protein 1C1 n=1 Tax=Silene latifolia TaxID=37657 RepID=UPI003D77A500
MTKIKGIVTLVLRLVALITTFVAIILMSTAHDTAHVFNLKFEAKFSNSPAFKYFVIAYAVVCCYSLAIIFLPAKSLYWRIILVLDTVMTLVLTSSFSAAMAIAYIGKKGNSHAGWLPICGQVPKFCDQSTAALAVGFVSAIVYFVLLIYSLHGALAPFCSVNS